MITDLSHALKKKLNRTNCESQIYHENAKKNNPLKIKITSSSRNNDAFSLEEEKEEEEEVVVLRWQAV